MVYGIGTSVRCFPKDIVARKHLVPIDVVKWVLISDHCFRFCQAQFQLASLAELRLALILIITNHPSPPPGKVVI